MSQILNNAGPFSLFNYSTDVGFGKLYITKKTIIRYHPAPFNERNRIKQNVKCRIYLLDKNTYPSVLEER